MTCWQTSQQTISEMDKYWTSKDQAAEENSQMHEKNGELNEEQIRRINEMCIVAFLHTIESFNEEIFA